MMIGLFLFAGCNHSNKGNEITNSNSSNHHIVVKEVQQTSSYTYLYVNENSEEYWIAVNKMDVEVGDDFYYEDALEMKEFKSKELDRVFEQVFFVEKISTVPIIAKTKTAAIENPQPKKATEIKKDIAVSPADGGITIADLFQNRNDYKDKLILVKGEVVKVNSKIMNLNWVHIQDGTSNAGNFDLTITTTEEVKVGDIVTFEGTVSLNKDFGAGYSYELILEGAKVK
jgi:hypothetical protein